MALHEALLDMQYGWTCSLRLSRRRDTDDPGSSLALYYFLPCVFIILSKVFSYVFLPTLYGVITGSSPSSFLHNVTRYSVAGLPCVISDQSFPGAIYASLYFSNSINTRSTTSANVSNFRIPFGRFISSRALYDSTYIWIEVVSIDYYLIGE